MMAARAINPFPAVGGYIRPTLVALQNKSLNIQFLNLVLI